MRDPVYIDNHATTACDPRVVQAMLPYFTERFGNAASRNHTWGLTAQAAVEHARTQVAALIGASAKEILWTSGATESNNIAILGAARARGSGHVITVATEHKAVLDPVEQLGREGFTTTVLSVGSDGRVDPAVLEAALRPDTVLVSVMAANNEIGTLQPLAEIGRLCRARGIVFHTDAAQAFGKIPLDVVKLHVDLLSISAHKVYGPKGIGALYVRRGRPQLKVVPVLFGGGHERGLRSGTLAVPLIVALGKAAELAGAELADGSIDQVRVLRDRLWAGLQARLERVVLNGGWQHRLGNNLNVSFRGVEAEALMMGLRDIALSSGSACTSATLQPSHVLRALGVDEETAHTSVRFGLGRFNTAEEVDYVIERVADKVIQLRELNPLNESGDGALDLRAIRYGEPLQ